jgi:alkyl sulfatase BDS1-like metallo-beta-lactamase superfamily hydrolase
MLGRQWESAAGRTKMAQIVIPHSNVKEVLVKIHRGPSGGHLRVNKTLDKIRQQYYWLHLRSNVER